MTKKPKLKKNKNPMRPATIVNKKGKTVKNTALNRRKAITSKSMKKIKKKREKRNTKKAPHLGKGWREVKTSSHFEVPKKARGKEGFPTSTREGYSYVYNKKKKKGVR